MPCLELMNTITLITDAWYPQINGVVTTWSHVADELRGQGYTFDVIHPDLFQTFRAPKYPEICLAILPGRKLRRMLDERRPNAIHIATEGPLGMAGRAYCMKRRLPFTTSYHTKFPEYLRTYFEIPQWPTYRFLRWFHGPAERTLVTTESMRKELVAEGFDDEQLITWTRGVKLDRFKVRPGETLPLDVLPRPIFLYCGRVAPEKNLEAFVSLELPGSKVVVGDGPALNDLRRQYPDTHYVGYKTGDDLARHVAAADVFVFPSLTDTFGVVMLEAMACGLPVAAFPVTGPIDVITDPKVGVLDHDLKAACLKALDLDPADARRFAERFTWARCANMVRDHLAWIGNPELRRTSAPA